MRVLLLEDHPGMREMMHLHLHKSGYAVDSYGRGAEALAAASRTRYDAAILDLGLPDLDGMEVLRRLRAGTDTDLPVIVLTARDAVNDRVDGLDAGADDYILKPFELAEFDARLRTILRRPGTRRLPVERFADLVFDPATREAHIGTELLELTRRETGLLEELVRAQGRTVVRDALEERLYGFDEAVTANALEAIVSRLRRRLAAASAAARIETVRGIGYRLAVEAGR